jgi:hypothetical protein
MSIIPDMSEPERQSWVTLLADGFVFIWFWKAVAPGWSLLPDAFSPEETAGLFLKLVIITIFYHAAISIIFALRRGKGNVERDERDLDIQSHGMRVGYLALQFGVGVLIVSALLSYIIGEDYVAPVALTTPFQFIFAMTFISYVADLSRHGAALLRYRTT